MILNRHHICSARIINRVFSVFVEHKYLSFNCFHISLPFRILHSAFRNPHPLPSVSQIYVTRKYCLVFVIIFSIKSIFPPYAGINLTINNPSGSGGAIPPRLPYISKPNPTVTIKVRFINLCSGLVSCFRVSSTRSSMYNSSVSDIHKPLYDAVVFKKTSPRCAPSPFTRFTSFATLGKACCCKERFRAPC